MAEKYNVALNLKNDNNNNNSKSKQNIPAMDKLSLLQASFVPLSVRKECMQGTLPIAPSANLVEATVLLADISGFTKLGEKLNKEHGDASVEIFASQVSAAISALVSVIQRYNGETVKFAGDCLICLFTSSSEKKNNGDGEEESDDEDDDEKDAEALENARLCCIDLLKIIKTTNPDLDLHGGVASGTVQRIHLKQLRGSSPRSNSARQRMKKFDEATMSMAELERSREQWFLVAGRPIKKAGSLLDKAKAGEIKLFGGMTITRETKANDIDMVDDNNEEEDNDLRRRKTAVRFSKADQVLADMANCHGITKYYIPPMAKLKTGKNTGFSSERRRVATVFVGVPGLAKAAMKPSGVKVGHLNDVFSAIKSILSKFEGLMRDFLFEDKGCTFIGCFGIQQMTEVDALRAVLFALEASAACSSLKEPCKIGISMGSCFTGVCGHVSRADYVVMGPEVNMAARLMGKAKTGSILASERVYNATSSHIGYDMTDPIELKGRDGTQRALRPFGKKAGAVRHKGNFGDDSEVFVGREEEMKKLRIGLKEMMEERKGSAFILEGLAGMGKSAIVWQLQREALEDNVRFLMGTGSAIEKQTPYFAFGQILCAAANLSTSPSYGEVLALKHTYDLSEDEINAIGIILPSLAKKMDDGSDDQQHGRLEALAAQVCLKVFGGAENAVFVFEDAHWIDSQSWLMLQMVLPQLSSSSMVMIVTRPPNMASQMKGGGTMGLEKNEDSLEHDMVEEDDRIKFSRILAGLKERAGITYLELGTMGIESTKELISKMLKVKASNVDENFLTLMHDKAGGIPMYLTSITAWLMERDLILKEDGSKVNFKGKMEDIKWPSSVVDTVLERVDCLNDVSKTLIKICSCFGFDFRDDNLEHVALQFMDKKSLEDGLVDLNHRGLIIPVTGETVAAMLKFTHQIITESTYQLMLEKQRKEIHKAIAVEYESSSAKFESEVLAHHWLRSGNVDRGCSLLEVAAKKAIQIGALKEAVNCLAQALAVGKEHANRPLWLGLLSYAKYQIGETIKGAHLALDGLELLGDETLLPQKHTQLSVDMLVREYGECDDVPKKTNVEGIPPLQEARRYLLLACARGSSNIWSPESIIPRIKKKYDLDDQDMYLQSEWWTFTALLQAYQEGDIDAWADLHCDMAQAFNRSTEKPDQGRQICRKCQTLSADTRLKPHLRSRCISQPMLWYPAIAPEFVKNQMAFLDSSYELVKGNMKYANYAYNHLGRLVGSAESIGDINLSHVYRKRLLTIKCDTEALEDQKFQIASGNVFAECQGNLLSANLRGMADLDDKLATQEKKFNRKSFFRFMVLHYKGYLSLLHDDYDTAKLYIEKSGVKSAVGFLGQFNTHVEFFFSWAVDTALIMSKQNPQDEDWKDILRTARTRYEMFETKIPGTFRISGPAWVAEISLTLKDRAVKKMVEKIEKAIEYGEELDCLPVDVAIAKLFFSKYKNDKDGVKQLIATFEKMGHKLRQLHAERILKEMESPDWVPIDLEFVPQGEMSPNEIKLAEIEKQLYDARAEAKAAAAAADRSRVQAARASVKQLKKEKKRLEKEIEEEKNNQSNSGNEAEIQALQQQISDAQARATEAEENDDEDAEEAAYAEMDELLAKLEVLKKGAQTPGKPEISKTKQNLEEAKQIDAEISSLDDLRDKIKKSITEDGKNLDLNAIVKMDFEGKGYIYIDAKSEPNIVSDENKDENIDCTVTLAFETLMLIKDGKADAMTMMGEGKIKIDGNMMVGIKGLQCIQSFI